MLFNITIFGIISGVPIEIDYNADMKLDVESFELPSVSGFEFDLPSNLVPILWNSSNQQYLIQNQIILRQDTEITVKDATGIITNSYFWIGTEKIKVTNIVGNVLTIERGKDSTHINRHFTNIESGVLLYMNTFPTSFVGLKVELKEARANKIYAIGTIESEPVFKSGLVHFSCADVIESLNVDLPKFYNDEIEREICGLYSIISDTITDYQSSSDDYYLLGSIPDFFDYFNIWGLFLSGDVIKVNANINTNDVGTYKDLMNVLLKMTKSVLFFDRDLSQYQTIQIAPTLSFETPEQIKMLDYLDASGEYSITKAENIKTVKFNYTQNGQEKKIIANLTNIAFGKTLDIDLKGFSNIDTKGIYSLILRYLYDTSLYYEIIQIDSSKIIVGNFKIGQIYEFTDVLNFSFQNISQKCMYLGNENDSIFFGIIRDFSKTLIAPAIPVTADGGKNLTFGFTNQDYKVQDFLNTNSLNVEFAKFQNRGVEIDYFTGDYFKVQLFNKSTGVLLSAEEIDTINKNTIIMINNITAGEYWLTYDVYANADTEQKKFFYFSIDEY